MLVDPYDHTFGLGIRKQDQLRYVDYARVRVSGMPPRVLDHEHYTANHEQALCMHQALDDSIRVQIVIGKAGTGKTHMK